MPAKVERINRAQLSGFNLRVAEFMNKIEYRRIETPEQLEDVYKLRYEAYRREEFIDKNTERLCTDSLDLAPNNTVFGLYLDKKLVSSIRVHILDKQNRESPSALVFSDKVEPMLDNGKVIVDPTRFTADFDCSRKHKALPYVTLRIAVMASVYHNADHCLSLVRPEHAAFYKKIYRSEQIGEVRYFPQINFPVVLYSAQVANIQASVFKKYPFFKASRRELETLFEPTRSAALA